MAAVHKLSLAPSLGLEVAGQFILEVLVPSIDQSLTLLQQLLQPWEQRVDGKHIANNPLTYNDAVYAYIFGNMLLLRKLSSISITEVVESVTRLQSIIASVQFSEVVVHPALRKLLA